MTLDKNDIARITFDRAKARIDGKAIGQHLRQRQGGRWSNITQDIKKVFGDLGRELGFRVAASGYVGADEGEWLYDMVWMIPGVDGMLKGQPLVLECELRSTGLVADGAGLDDDFLKLVQARADVRTWVTACPNSEMVERHLVNCKTQAAAFSDAQEGDTYLFVIFDHSKTEIVFDLFTVGNIVS